MQNEMFKDGPTQQTASVPGAQESSLLLLDAALTLLRLGKGETVQMLATVPRLLGLNLYRLPLLLLTWISFGVLVSSAVYAFTGAVVLASGSFFLLQLMLTILLERQARRLRTRMRFIETRAGIAALQASIRERMENAAD